jgi:hypothetical protein
LTASSPEILSPLVRRGDRTASARRRELSRNHTIYDYGILGSIAITAFIALVFSTSATGAVIAIASAVLMMTDNVVMYLYYQFPIVLMVGYSALRESRAQGTA